MTAEVEKNNAIGSWLVLLEGYTSARNVLGVPWTLQLLVIEDNAITFYDPAAAAVVHEYSLKALVKVSHGRAQSVLQFCFNEAGEEKYVTFSPYLERHAQAIVIFLAKCKECGAVPMPTPAALELLVRFSIQQEEILPVVRVDIYLSEDNVRAVVPSTPSEEVGIVCGKTACRIVRLTPSEHMVRLPNVRAKMKEDAVVDTADYSLITQLNYSLETDVCIGVDLQKIWICEFATGTGARFAARLVAARSHYRRFVDAAIK